MIGLTTMATFLLPFYVDELTTMAMRLKRKENLLKAHRSHFYQFLANEKSIPHWQISVAYGITQLTIGLLALRIHPHGLLPSLIFFITAFTLLATTRHTTQSILHP